MQGILETAENLRECISKGRHDRITDIQKTQDGSKMDPSALGTNNQQGNTLPGEETHDGSSPSSLEGNTTPETPNSQELSLGKPVTYNKAACEEQAKSLGAVSTFNDHPAFLRIHKGATSED